MRDDTEIAQSRSGQEAAEALALTALAYVLEDAGRTDRFLRVTGVDGAGLPTLLQDPLFLGCILDFVLEDETLLIAVSAVAGVRADRMAAMRRRLPGVLIAE